MTTDMTPTQPPALSDAPPRNRQTAVWRRNARFVAHLRTERISWNDRLAMETRYRITHTALLSQSTADAGPHRRRDGADTASWTAQTRAELFRTSLGRCAVARLPPRLDSFPRTYGERWRKRPRRVRNCTYAILRRCYFDSCANARIESAVVLSAGQRCVNTLRTVPRLTRVPAPFGLR
jgi:hypothetical protein